MWRASGPFVKEAWRLISSVDETLCKLVSRGYPLASGADKVHAALSRLRTILDQALDEAEAFQAAGEWTGTCPLPDWTRHACRIGGEWFHLTQGVW